MKNPTDESGATPQTRSSRSSSLHTHKPECCHHTQALFSMADAISTVQVSLLDQPLPWLASVVLLAPLVFSKTCHKLCKLVMGHAAMVPWSRLDVEDVRALCDPEFVLAMAMAEASTSNMHVVMQVSKPDACWGQTEGWQVPCIKGAAGWRWMGQACLSACFALCAPHQYVLLEWSVHAGCLCRS
jgi:hypothetical protein